MQEPFERLALVVLVASAGGCCCGGDDYLTLGIGLWGPAGITTPLWGEAMDVGPSPVFTAAFAEDDHPSGDVFELWNQGNRLPLLVTSVDWADNPDRTGSCPHDEQVYEAQPALEPGDYTLVHLERHGNGSALNCLGQCPWTTFEGDRALVLDLHVSSMPSRDGGADAGPGRDD
ncbi:MAG: hypothetical protein HYY06_30260 [Deltaproteobacteria bacterium]|nr:hypothetical protein [Deltaproteobacteria bacterium]